MRHAYVFLLVLACVIIGVWWFLPRNRRATGQTPSAPHALAPVRSSSGRYAPSPSVVSAQSNATRPQEIVFLPLPSESEARATQYRKERGGSIAPRLSVAHTAKVNTALLLDATGSEGTGLNYTWEITRPDGTVDLVVSQSPVTNYVVGSTGIVRGVLLLSDKLHRVKPANFDVTVTP